jgi:hypothetical protein
VLAFQRWAHGGAGSSLGSRRMTPTGPRGGLYDNELFTDERLAGLVRETYLVGHCDTDDTSAWLTEIGWPVFRTSAA